MLIGYREFTDGQTRQVYLDEDNEQYVIQDDDQLIYGVWIVPEEIEPAILARN